MNRRPTVLAKARTLSPIPIALALLLLAATLTVTTAARGDQFGDYWYQGQAELTSYTLEQTRYGEVHPGHAVLIFVTEDFSRSKHVKLDRPSAAGDDSVGILKLNFTKKFNTGLYPYSMMTSVFTPIDSAETLKITTSTQEWCGHTWIQLNRTEAGFRAQQNSYFESEGDVTVDLPAALPEDGLWTTLRLNPSKLPTGTLQLLPGTMFQSLRHLPWGAHTAEAELEPHGDGLMAYTLNYSRLGRTLTIHFQEEFPHEIEGWEETTRSGYGANAEVLTTRATRNRSILSNYWARNRVIDGKLRKELGLP